MISLNWVKDYVNLEGEDLKYPTLEDAYLTTMVMHQMSPNTQEMTANSHPKTRIQRTFRRNSKRVYQYHK